MESDTAYKLIRRAVELFVNYPLTSDRVLVKALIKEGQETVLANKLIFFTYTAFGYTFLEEMGASLPESYLWFTGENSSVEIEWKDEPIFQYALDVAIHYRCNHNEIFKTVCSRSAEYSLINKIFNNNPELKSLEGGVMQPNQCRPYLDI